MVSIAGNFGVLFDDKGTNEKIAVYWAALRGVAKYNAYYSAINAYTKRRSKDYNFTKRVNERNANRESNRIK